MYVPLITINKKTKTKKWKIYKCIKNISNKKKQGQCQNTIYKRTYERTNEHKNIHVLIITRLFIYLFISFPFLIDDITRWTSVREEDGRSKIYFIRSTCACITSIDTIHETGWNDAYTQQMRKKSIILDELYSVIVLMNKIEKKKECARCSRQSIWITIGAQIRIEIKRKWRYYVSFFFRNIIFLLSLFSKTKVLFCTENMV